MSCSVRAKRLQHTSYVNPFVGQLVGNFTNYFLPNTTVTQAEFQASINQLALYIVYLFIAKFVLSYISLVLIRSFYILNAR
jgi:ATP-binding cassette subfamily B (MDR/TAP) protein 1